MTDECYIRFAAWNRICRDAKGVQIAQTNCKASYFRNIAVPFPLRDMANHLARRPCAQGAGNIHP
jgi:hypothetical protein